MGPRLHLDHDFLALTRTRDAASDSAGTFALSRDGDFVQYLDPLNVRLGTVRDLYRPDFPPRVELFDPSKPVPVQTSAIASFGSVLGTWFGGRKVYTGAEMETIRECLLLWFDRISSLTRLRWTSRRPEPSSVEAESSDRRPTPSRHDLAQGAKPQSQRPDRIRCRRRRRQSSRKRVRVVVPVADRVRAGRRRQRA